MGEVLWSVENRVYGCMCGGFSMEVGVWRFWVAKIRLGFVDLGHNY
jgi:hypothetical protein